MKKWISVFIVFALAAVFFAGMAEAGSAYTFILAWGSGGSSSGQFNNPYGVAVDGSGNVYVADTGNNRIQKFTSGGAYVTQWGTAGSGNGQFSNPYGVAVDGSGNVYVSETINNRIQKFTSSGVWLTRWGSSGSGNGQFSSPHGVAVDGSGNIYVADSSNNRIQVFDSTGAYVTQWGSGGSGNGQFNSPRGVAVDSSGKVYVADSGNKRIQVFSVSGALSATVYYNGSPLQNAYMYLQNGAALPPLQQYYQKAAYIYGPSSSSGVISASVPAGTYYVMIIKRAGGSSYMGPPLPGDYVWFNLGAITIGTNTYLGTVNATVYGGSTSLTISGTVKGQSGKALAGWAVKATAVPCESGNWGYAHSFNECGVSKYPAWTDSNGNYTITLTNSGTYYVYASPRLNFANTNYPGGYPTCTAGVGCEACGDYFYYNCPVNVSSPVTGQNIVVPGY